MTNKSLLMTIAIISIAISSAAQVTGTLTDTRDGEKYKTVKIGNQVWMAENLRATRNNDGTAIPLVTDKTEWSKSETPAYCWYNNDATAFKATYGPLYNWYTVNTGKLCPAGWHVPTDAEWTTLITYLGGERIADGKLKKTGKTQWLSPNAGDTNESGFSALPGGLRYDDGAFSDIGYAGYWWSSTEARNGAYYIHVPYNYGTVLGYYIFKKQSGFSVRCLKD